jgi:hypothetical protein
MRHAFGCIMGLLVLATAQSTLAQPAPDLGGESFQAADAGDPDTQPGTIIVTSFSCTDTAGHVSYIASGPATGPYTGTFWEAGTVALGPPRIFLAGREVQRFEAHFLIHSSVPPAIVAGRKTIEIPAPIPPAAADCVNDANGTFLSASLFAGVTYEATIRTQTHTCVDRGSSVVDVVIERSPFRSEGFSESFITDGQAPTCTPNRGRGTDDD